MNNPLDQFRKLERYEGLFLVSIIALIASLPLSDMRFFGMSVSSFVALSVLIAGLWSISRDHFHEFLAHRRALVLLCAIFVGSFFLKAMIAGTIHGWGIFIEWVLLPVLVGLCVACANISHNFLMKSVTGGALVALAAMALSGCIHLVYGALTYDGRLSAQWLSPNHFALLGGPLLVYCTVSLYGARNIAQRRVGWCIVALFSIPFVLTQSLGGIFAVSAMIGVFVLGQLYFTQKQWRRGFVALCGDRRRMHRNWGIQIFSIL